MRRLAPLPAALAFLVAPCAALTQSSANAQSPAPGALVTPAPIRAGALTAYKYGSGPKTLVLIPGLASGAFVWDSTVAALQSKYTIYTVTFDGFDGMLPAKPPYLPAFTRSVEDLMQSQKLRNPILVGHSLGGNIALDVAIDNPAALAGVVAVDSLPLFPPLQPGETLAARQTNAPKFGAAMMSQSDAQYAAASRQTIGAMVTNPAQADAIEARALKSDRATVAGAAVELASTDLTPLLPKITVPVLVITSSASYGADATKSFFQAQYKGLPNVTILPIDNARHFVMYDQPAAFVAALTGFADGLK